jgi:hypothetical protein
MRLSENGRLDLQPTALSWMQRALRVMRVSELVFTWDAAQEAGCLVDVNGDPVDRGLLGAAIAIGATLVTRDEDLLASGSRRAFASWTRGHERHAVGTEHDEPEIRTRQARRVRSLTGGRPAPP